MSMVIPECASTSPKGGGASVPSVFPRAPLPGHPCIQQWYKEQSSSYQRPDTMLRASWVLFLPVFQTRKQKHREAKSFARGYLGRKSRWTHGQTKEQGWRTKTWLWVQR